ncbi:MAG: neutral zinc metallopeptidase [Dehalococcoidia bacterium]
MPRYNRGARLDPTQVQDVRGRRFGGGAPIAVGGGSIGLIIFIAMLLLGGDPFSSTSNSLDGGQTQSDLATECQTGADAEERQDCRLLLFVNSIQEYWTSEFQQSGGRYQPAVTQFFSQATQTGCGNATSAVGPFYCPPDRKVYIDLTFFEELQRRFGAQGGDFAEAYVVAHEYGHHIQNLTGTLNGGQGGSGAESASVRTELQADCYAGVWAKNAVATGYIEELSSQDIAIGLDAAAAVGDDRIQQSSGGRVNPEKFTHGTSAQRQKWFTNGYQTGSPDSCDTFNNPI